MSMETRSPPNSPIFHGSHRGLQNTALFESFVRSLPYDYTFLQDTKGNFLYCSPNLQQVGFQEGEDAAGVLSAEPCAALRSHCSSIVASPNSQIETTTLSASFLDDSKPTEDWDMTLFSVFDEESEEGIVGVGGLIHVVQQQQQQHPSSTTLTETPKEEETNCLNAIMNASAAGIVLLDREGVILKCSHSFAAQFGSSEDSIRGRIVWSLASETDDCFQKLNTTVTEVFENGEDVKCTKVNANSEWKEYRASPAVVEHGQVQAVLVESWDVTERTKAELELHEKNAHYHGLFHHLPTAYALHEIVTDDHGTPCDYRFLEVNQHFEEMTGLSAKTTIGKTVTEVLPGIENDPSNWIDRFGRVGLDGYVDKFSQHSDSLAKWYSGISYSPSQGKAVTLFLDVTEQKEMEESLRQSEEQHRTLFETMKQGVSYVNADYQYADCNPSALKYLGLTMDQFQGRTSVDPRWNTIHEDGTDWPSEDHPVNQVLKTGKPVSGFIMGVFNPQDDNYRWLSIDCTPRFRPGEDRPYQACAVFTDITEARQVEAALLHAKEQAEEADKLKSAFLATMSHEIRTPLNGIMGHLDLILSNELEESSKMENLDGLQVAMQSGKLLISIIEDILDLSKIEAGQLDISHKPFSLFAVIEQTMQLAHAYRIQRKKEHIELCQEVQPVSTEFIYGDELRLQQILNNLVSNAIKFTDQGSVTLSVSCCNGSMLFCVRDTGKGIPEEKLGVIFEPFRQVDLSDTREHGGTGLGLTICRKLVELMRGTLRVESSASGENQGSRFYMTIPFEPVPDNGLKKGLPRPDSRTMLSVEHPLSFDSQVSGKVLIAEDDPVSRKIVVRMLEKAGRDSLVAKDGLEAIHMYERHRFEIALIFMDVMMPNLDGLEASKRIRGMESDAGVGHGVPIIALSAGAMKGDREKGIEYGMTDYLTKPISYKALVATLETHLGRAMLPG